MDWSGCNNRDCNRDSSGNQDSSVMIGWSGNRDSSAMVGRSDNGDLLAVVGWSGCNNWDSSGN